MPAIARRKRAVAATSQKSIQQFGRVSKAQLAPSNTTFLKQRLGIQEAFDKEKVAQSHPSKRKASAIEDLGEYGQVTEPAAPSTPRKKAKVKSYNAETPTKGARSLFEAFNLSSSASNKRNISRKQLETPPSSQEGQTENELCAELNDLVDMHSCLLTALSLHYAHNSLMTPADLRVLCPNVARVWRRRRIEQKDIQRLLPLQRRRGKGSDIVADTFILTDYGHGKICLEFATVQRNPMDQRLLNALFQQNIRLEWEGYCSTTQTVPNAADFMVSLPLTPITPSPSLIKVVPLLSKGQTRLTELKAGAIRAQERALSISSVNTSSNTTKPRSKDPFERSMDLKSRIFAKQLHQSSLPAPLSHEQMARRSALLRLAEVAPVLESLALSGQKHRNDDAGDNPFQQVVRNASFTMPTLVQNLQMSLRSPIAAEEAGRCIRLLAGVMPEWVVVREVGRLVGVTVRGTSGGRAVLAKRVEEALATA